MYGNLDEILALRKQPDMPEHLSARIIAASLREEKSRFKTPQRSPSNASGIMGLFDAFISRPAVALAVLVLFLGVGLYAGVEIDMNDLIPELSNDNLASFMMIDDDAGFGDWV